MFISFGGTAFGCSLCCLVRWMQFSWYCSIMVTCYICWDVENNCTASLGYLDWLNVLNNDSSYDSIHI
jgi:hypothetical protein